MTEIFNRVEEREKRRALRSEMPLAERLVWARLRRKQVPNARFRRQYSVGPYVLDFYCPSLKLALEIDGKSHQGEQAQGYDSERQAFIEALGIRFLRFTNRDVLDRLDEVVHAIQVVCRPPLVPLLKGDGEGSDGVVQRVWEATTPPVVPLAKGDREGGDGDE